MTTFREKLEEILRPWTVEMTEDISDQILSLIDKEIIGEPKKEKKHIQWGDGSCCQEEYIEQIENKLRTIQRTKLKEGK